MCTAGAGADDGHAFDHCVPVATVFATLLSVVQRIQMLRCLCHRSRDMRMYWRLAGIRADAARLRALSEISDSYSTHSYNREVAMSPSDLA